MTIKSNGDVWIALRGCVEVKRCRDYGFVLELVLHFFKLAEPIY